MFMNTVNSNVPSTEVTMPFCSSMAVLQVVIRRVRRLRRLVTPAAACEFSVLAMSERGASVVCRRFYVVGPCAGVAELLRERVLRMSLALLVRGFLPDSLAVGRTC